MEYIVPSFFRKEVENEINGKMFYRNYLMDSGSVLEYIDQLLDTPLSSFLEYIVSKVSVSYVTFQDVVQYSSLYDATCGICRVLGSVDDGLKNIEVGRLLLNDGKERKDGALRKYGENHAKTGIELGLVQESYCTYYLSCLGSMYNMLTDTQKTELLRRTILRNRFFQKVLKKAQIEKVSLFKEMSFLAESTAKRRLSNVKLLYSILKGQGDETSLRYFDNICVID